MAAKVPCASVRPHIAKDFGQFSPSAVPAEELRFSGARMLDARRDSPGCVVDVDPGGLVLVDEGDNAAGLIVLDFSVAVPGRQLPDLFNW